MSKPEMIEVEAWIIVDADGEYEVGKDEEVATEAFGDNVGGNGPRRMVKVILSVPKPTVATLRGVVPAEGEATLTVA